MVAATLALATGVAVGAFSVETTMWMRHATELSAADFGPAFVIVAVISAASAFYFFRMPADAGHEISGRRMVVPEAGA